MSARNSAYCQARARLPLSLLEKLHGHLVAHLQSHILGHQLWLGERRVRIVDGTTVSMPDTAASQKAWPQPSGQKPGCGFPAMKLVGLFCLASGALLEVVFGSKHEHDLRLFRELWDLLEPGDILLADRGFCCFGVLAHLLSRKVDSVLRLHRARKVDLRKGRRLGKGDRLVVWQRPVRSAAGLDKDQIGSLPEKISVRLLRFAVEVRGFRTREVTLVTTLLDTQQYPAALLQELYLRRWAVELHFREIKTLLGMDVLRCLSPAMIEKELWLHVIAYNLVRCVMQEAAARHDAELESLSFKGALDTMRHFADPLHATRRNPRLRRALFEQLLSLVARDTLPWRPSRSEPRARKRRAKNYHLLTKTRRQMGNLPHRNRPGKPAPKPALS